MQFLFMNIQMVIVLFTFVFAGNTKVCQKRIASGKNVCYTDELTGERHDGNLSGCIQEMHRL